MASMSALRRYIKSRPPGALRALAHAVGVTPVQMGRIVSGKRGASLSTAIAIAKATGGEITPADVFAAKSGRARKTKVASV